MGLLWDRLSWWVAGLPTQSFPTTSSLTAHCTPVIFQIEARTNLLLSLGMKLKPFRVVGRPLVTCLLLPTQPFKLPLRHPSILVLLIPPSGGHLG